MKKVLLIEDDKDVRENTADILELADYEVVTAENGACGVQKAKQFIPDIVVCDVMMPGMDGYTVLKLLREDDHTAGTPFIFLTAKTSRADMRFGMNLGADDYVTKPFEEKELLDAIECRLKKDEFLRKELVRNIKGINTFLEGASYQAGLEDLIRQSGSKEYHKDEMLFWEGDAVHCLFFIQTGTIKTYKGTESGKEFVTGIFSAGDFVGQLSLLNSKGTFVETAVVMEDSRVCSIPKKSFTRLLYTNQVVSKKFLAMLSNNLINVQEHLVDMAYASVRQRAAKALLELYEKGIILDKVNGGVGIPREDFAGIIGTATETAIRTLSDFKEEGLITTDHGRRIVLRDKEALQYIADFK